VISLDWHFVGEFGRLLEYVGLGADWVAKKGHLSSEHSSGWGRLRCTMWQDSF
jgi:hypothetical protein